MFYKDGDYVRNHLRCARCNSIPRWRALIYVLSEFIPDWRDLTIHESSPDGAASEKLATECAAYTPTFFYPDVEGGTSKDGVRCENLEAQTFPDEVFDIVVTQDVLEHVFDPAAAFRDIARTLKPGGAHVFTVPWFYWQPTLTRAVLRDGEVQHLVEPDYHGDPIDPRGTLVVTEWGPDLCDFIYESSALTTTPVRVLDHHRGIEGQFIEVFISRKGS